LGLVGVATSEILWIGSHEGTSSRNDDLPNIVDKLASQVAKSFPSKNW